MTMREKNCYGHYQAANPACQRCEYLPWCRDSRDLPLSGHLGFEQMQEYCRPESEPAIDREEESEPGIFTLAQMRKIAIALLAIPDRRIRDIIRMKLENPQITLRELGNQFGVTRQAVSQNIANFCNRHREWKKFLLPGHRPFATEEWCMC